MWHWLLGILAYLGLVAHPAVHAAPPPPPLAYVVHQTQISDEKSVFATVESAYVVPAAMAKAAVHAMTMSLAVEWGPYGIRVNAIAPGPFPTDSAWEKLNPLAETAIGPTQTADVPLRRFGKMDELRHLMIFLMSDGCGYITGDTISIDGGHHLAAPSTFAGLSKLSKEEWQRAREAIQASSRKEKAGRSA